jgi:hypothetical protein
MGIKDRIESVYNSLQDLDMKPTPHNVGIMGDVYFTLRGIYRELEEAENAGAKDGTAADPGGRDEA